ncbi:pentapeptide repeat-containing protein [Nocardia fusca]|uniref:pentapeptide repeat-containing protein n=1 Tax=Nocardia fusca TaxID=941183 RepID=UPI0037CB052E
MTENHRDADRPITITNAFDALGDYYTEQHGPSSPDRGWERLARALDAEEHFDEESTTLLGPGETAANRVSWWQWTFFKYLAAGALMGAGAVGTFKTTGVQGFLSNVLMVVALLIFVGALMQGTRRRIAAAEAERLNREDCAKFVERHARLTAVHSAAETRQATIANMGKTAAPGIIDLTEADLTTTDLTEVNLIGALLRGVMLDGKNLRAANLYGADLSGAGMFAADLSRAELSDAHLAGAELGGAQLVGARLTRANLTGANLTGVNLSGAILSGANLTGVNLSGAMLSGAELAAADFTGATLTSAYLTRAYLAGAHLEGARLAGANLRGAHLRGANMSCADLTGADLTHTDLRKAVLIGADLTGAKLIDLADLEEVTWSEATLWGRYRQEVIERSIPLGRGCYRLNPAEGSSPGPIVPIPRVPA